MCAAVALALMACASEEPQPVQTKAFRFDVGMQIVAFPTETQVFDTIYMYAGPTKAVPANGVVSALEYIALHDGAVRNRLSAKAGDEGFGRFTDELPFGENRVFIVGHNSTGFADSEGVASFVKVSDTFVKELNIAVDDGTNSSPAVVLERAAGKIEILTTDAIPPEVGGIRIEIGDFNDRLPLYGERGTARTALAREFVYGDAQREITGIRHSIYSFVQGDAENYTVTVTVFGTDNQAMYVRTLTDVPVYRNRITRFTGELYKPEAQNNRFDVTIDNVWGEEINRPL